MRFRLYKRKKKKKEKEHSQNDQSGKGKIREGRTGQGNDQGEGSVTDVFLLGAPAFFQILILLGESF